MTPSIQERFKIRYEELEQSYAKIPMKSNYDSDGFYSSGDWRQWATSAQHLIISTFGERSSHSKNFDELYKVCGGSDYELAGLRAIFRSAKQDYNAGFAVNFELLVSGEVFGDFVRLAKQALSEGHKDVAAVLASAALEDALKKFAILNSVILVDANMQEVINSLKAKGLVGGAQKTLIDSMPKIRNHSLHAEWNKITETEVGSILGFVEQFLLTKFGPG